ncbi:FecCD family ABC transporter permease [Pseudogemmobacter hezensis]|uniref:FecCD family ABC transporter permease n=1 Tax=Pseudogemmobacter hezensis TaxID=2737662 RepID=UPI001C1318CC|nr:iron ABC transporter permease [Pseudogemmobacter hezensis]
MSAAARPLLLPLAGAALAGLTLLAIFAGRYPLGLSDLAAVAMGGSEDPMLRTVLFEFRLPRILLAMSCGMAMALSGAVLQTLTRNPLAAPGLIGVEAGASITVLAAMVLWPGALAVGLYPLAGFTGAIAVAGTIAGLAWRQGVSPLRLLLVGVGVTALLSAFSDLLITYGRIERVESALLWLSGRLHRAAWDQVQSQIIWLILAGLPILLLWRHFDLFQLGDSLAASRGLNPARFQIAALFLCTMLTASAVANVGMMSFIGLLAPHLARQLAGAIIVLAADTIGRSAFAPVQIRQGWSWRSSVRPIC